MRSTWEIVVVCRLNGRIEWLNTVSQGAAARGENTETVVAETRPMWHSSDNPQRIKALFLDCVSTGETQRFDQTSGGVMFSVEFHHLPDIDRVLILAKEHKSTPNPKLTKRERHALEMTAVGLTTKEIAMQLDVEPSTVNTLRSRACRKLKARTPAQAVYIATKDGVI